MRWHHEHDASEIEQNEESALWLTLSAVTADRSVPVPTTAVPEETFELALTTPRANIAIKVFGDDLGTLRRLGTRVRDAVASVPGVVDLSLEQQMDVPFVRFVLNRASVARYGLHVDDVAELLAVESDALRTHGNAD